MARDFDDLLQLQFGVAPSLLAGHVLEDSTVILRAAGCNSAAISKGGSKLDAHTRIVTFSKVTEILTRE
jgi:hypothetical protein